ncbi:hypothetical protein KO525_18775 [Psychrosphaera sp. B3R10]|uniref:hypothetical protein n=1 Tax=unclassified Psychrosphaera TaxID=2641570 RepID=UPI001C081D12|nr:MULTISPECIES: hypothetical protein [unclassified Psychrosphaera]MBU2880468.1 hypothetical protein [Psychrosphaera sp. I2R16]MBU2991431.1 hypothetical protein [Psychrosphaera sp. B3R10]
MTVSDKTKRNFFGALFIIFIVILSYSVVPNRIPVVSCEDVTWNDVVLLVQPHLDDTLNAALVMQGQSSEYHPSAAAIQVMDEPLPENIKRTLKAIIKADC